MSTETADDIRAPSPTALPLLLTAGIDLVAVTIFVLIGRANHHHGFAILGVLQTLWPFVVGAAVGWSLVYVYSHIGSSDWFGHDFRPERVASGVVIWLCTIIVGMILRYLLHQGVAVSFVIVASISTALFLIGWRAAAAVIARRLA